MPRSTRIVLGGSHLPAPAGLGHPEGLSSALPVAAASHIPASIRRDGE